MLWKLNSLYSLWYIEVLIASGLELKACEDIGRSHALKFLKYDKYTFVSYKRDIIV